MNGFNSGDWNRYGRFMDKNTVLSVILAAAAVAIVLRITPEFVQPNMKADIYKNKTDIRSIHQSRDTTHSKTVKLDKVDLERGRRLAHPVLGEFAFVDHFFMDIKARITVRVGGAYHFVIGSDDGFALYVDGELICEHTGDRPMSYDTCNVRLDEGEHTIKLSYFQGFGQSGLRATYAHKPDRADSYFVGEDSRYMEFRPPLTNSRPTAP